MAGFRDHIRSAGETARAVGHEARSAYQEFQGQGGVRGVAARPEVRAMAKSAAAHTFTNYLKDRSNAARRKGGYVASALFRFAHMAMHSMSQRLGAEQRIFENVAKVRRGDPHVANMSHQQLREVADNAQHFGGQHAHNIRQHAEGELDRRANRRVDERTRAYANQTAKLHGVREEMREDSLHGRLKRMDRVQAKRMEHLSETQKSQLSHEQRRLKMRAALGLAAKPPKPPKAPRAKAPAAAQTPAAKPSIHETPKSSKQYTVIGQTKGGGEIRRSRSGTQYTVGASKLKGLKGTKTPRPRTR